MWFTPALVPTLILFAASVSAAPPAAEPRQSAECERLNKEIKRVHSRMRAGYTAKQGERLAARLRKLRQQRAKACR